MGGPFKKLLLFLLFGYHLAVVASEPKPLVVVLDWFINPNHAPLLVAEQEGFFKQQGISVKLISPADSSSGEKLVASNQADIAITYQPALLYHVNNGLPLIRFATLIDSPLNCLVVLKNSNIQSMKDLAGKKIGYSAAAIDGIMLATMLKAVNLQRSDLNLINVKFNLIQALLTRRIDGFTGGMRNFEPIALELAGYPAKMFYPEAYGFPKYDELVLVAHKNTINNPALIKFTSALKQGVDYLKKNPHQSWRKFSTDHPELNTPLNRRAWLATLPYFAIDPKKLNQVRYKNLAKFMYQQGMIKYLPKIGDYAVEL